MTARDFTPTDEQVRDCAMHLFQADTGKEIPRVDEFAHYLGLARMVFATDAQKSIIAAAKAEALRDLAWHYRRSMKFAKDHRIDAALMIQFIESRADEIGNQQNEASA